ncbi:MAG: CPBP family intramembrane metalloprotease [Spirochaetales bacterium]|jgi:hypothetical protein|nr:CPBP family intramembrane metalloprotease [Spirochaetales bacterium]
MKRAVFSLLLIIALCGSVFAETSSENPPDYARMMVLNALLPGTAQRILGKLDEAKIFYASLPISIAGISLLAAAAGFSSGEAALDLGSENGRTYLFSYTGEESSAAEILMYGGMILNLYGNLLSAYSSYAAHRDYVDTYDDPFHPEALTTGRIRLSEAVVAPFKRENVLSLDVLPMLGLMTLSGLSVDDWKAVGGYFRRDQVDLFGLTVSPAAGLGAQLGIAALMTTATAVWEELLYRGVSLEVNGPVYSSVTFGLAHLPNMLVPGVSIEDTLLQTFFAGAFGFYAADRVVQKGYHLERMITLHFWNNILGIILKFMSSPDEEPGFFIRYKFLY